MFRYNARRERFRAAFLANFACRGKSGGRKTGQDQVEDAGMKSMVAVLACLMLTPALAGAAEEGELYKDSCAVCHDTGAAGAPRKGDQVAWQPRLEKDMETLVKHVREGFRGMPPKGMCSQCSDDDFRALIRYMTE